MSKIYTEEKSEEYVNYSLLVLYAPRLPSKRKGGPFFLLEEGLGARLTACLLPVVHLLEGMESSCLIVVSVPDPQHESLSVMLYTGSDIRTG